MPHQLNNALPVTDILTSYTYITQRT